MRDDWFQLETQRQAFEAAEPVDDTGWSSASAERGEPGLVLGIGLTLALAALLVLGLNLLL